MTTPPPFHKPPPIPKSLRERSLRERMRFCFQGMHPIGKVLVVAMPILLIFRAIGGDPTDSRSAHSQPQATPPAAPSKPTLLQELEQQGIVNFSLKNWGYVEVYPEKWESLSEEERETITLQLAKEFQPGKDFSVKVDGRKIAWVDEGGRYWTPESAAAHRRNTIPCELSQEQEAAVRNAVSEYRRLYHVPEYDPEKGEARVNPAWWESLSHDQRKSVASYLSWQRHLDIREKAISILEQKSRRLLAQVDTSGTATLRETAKEEHIRRVNEKYTKGQQEAARKLVEVAKASGLEMRREPGIVYVNPTLWATMPLDQKESMMRAFRIDAEIRDPDGWVSSIRDGYSGKELMKWGVLSGPTPVN